MNFQGVNQITLACTDLPKSIAFYRNTLGAILCDEWEKGASFELGNLSLRLALEPVVTPRKDDSLIAFTCPAPTFDYTADHIAETAPLWKSNTSKSASLHFLDPDGHRLELHAAPLQDHFDHFAELKTDGMRIYH